MTLPDPAASSVDDLAAQLYKALDGQDPERMRAFLRQHAELEQIKEILGPQSAEELWQWVKDRVGVELSRVAVCPGHSSQLEMAWELYSFAVTRVLWVMSRGGGKTSLAAWVDECQAEHFPGWSTFTIGANRTQGDRKYEYLLPLVVEGGVIGGKELDHVIRSIATKTELKNGSKMEIALGSSPDNANGPRVPRLHRDEIELMDPTTKKQAGNIPAGRATRDGRYVPAQILDTSTMKFAEGPVDKEIQAYRAAKEKGIRPQMEVRISCVFEAAAENPFCRSVPEDVRRARLRELGLPEDRLCDCETWVSDVWPAEDDTNEEPEPRTLESVCQGRFFRSRGYKRFDDIQTLFLENDRETWSAEQECAQPATEGAYIKSYSQVRNGIKGFVPDASNGIIDQAVDWGADDEHACFPGSVLLSGPKPEGVSCRPYSGELVEIVVATGEVLPVTPNHPVLTDRGWMPAKDVGRGDYLFRDPRQEHHQGVGPEDDDQMRSFADVFDSLKVARPSTVSRRLVHPLDFHGDVAREAEIDVVGSYSRLRNDVLLAEFSEPRSDETFLVGDPSSAAFSPLGHRDSLFLSRFGSDSSSSGSSLLSAHPFARFGAHLGLDELAGFTRSAGRVASLTKALPQRGMADTDLLRQSKHRLTSVMAASQVVDVRKKHFRGHVFNAETTPHWYFANGFVVSNCIWFQTLDQPVRAKSFLSGQDKILPVGALVAFGEIYESGIGNTALGKKVIEKETKWTLEVPGFRVFERYPDSANLGARLDWRDELGLITTSRIKKDFQEELKLVRTRIGTVGGFYIDISACPWFDKAIRAWRQHNGREVHNFASHHMAAFRYREHNIQVAVRKAARSQRGSGAGPAAADDEADRVRERELELVAAGGAGGANPNPLKRHSEPVEMIAGDPDGIAENREVYDDVAAEDSPLRRQARSMGGESDWRAGFGGLDR